MTWFNGMVEFWNILFNEKMVVLGNCDRTNAWLPTSQFVEGSGHYIVH